jgi:18S rRNA (guanine1575-N7)-methyltransferase
MPRPEVQAPPEIFYNESEARKYTTSSRIIEIQARISERALELLALPNDGVPRMLLDIGLLLPCALTQSDYMCCYC